MYNQKYLENLITNKIEESLHLDYKAPQSLEKNDKRRNELAKDVSAFANSAGGIIIYGITENNIEKHLPEKIEPLSRKLIDKEWIEQTIQSRIQPKIDDILIHAIEIDGDSDKVVYVIEIPQSTTAHQSHDHKYYKRHNFNSIPMYDYEIRDTLNRLKNPKIELQFKVITRTYVKDAIYSIAGS